MYDDRWYPCLIEDRSGLEEPDWSRIPPAKREQVRQQFFARTKVPAEPWLLWGPQIPFFQRYPLYTVTVLAQRDG